MTTPPKDAPVTEAERLLTPETYIGALRAARDAFGSFDDDDMWRFIANLQGTGLTIVEAATAARSDEIDGRAVHAAWRDGMLAQGREVAPERMAWETLTQQDRDLDDGIAARLRSEQGERTPRVDSEIDAT